MARKLKTYQTSLGFFEQAIAAPSMKAALEAWGADSNLFHQGAAKESHDPDVIAATMAKPGVVLKRPVGSDGPFGEHAELPKNLGQDGGKKAARKPPAKARKVFCPAGQGCGAEGRTSVRTGASASRARGSQGGGGQAEGARTQAAGGREGPSGIGQGRARTRERADAIRDEAEALEKKSQAEEARWEKEKERLDEALRRARD